MSKEYTGTGVDSCLFDFMLFLYPSNTGMLSTVDWMHGSPPESVSWSPNPWWDGIWRWGRGGVIRDRWCHESKALSAGVRQTACCPYPSAQRRGHVSREQIGSYKKPSKKASEENSSWSWTSQLPELGGIKFCCLSHLVSGYCVKHPEMTNTCSHSSPVPGRIRNGTWKQACVAWACQPEVLERMISCQRAVSNV